MEQKPPQQLCELKANICRPSHRSMEWSSDSFRNVPEGTWWVNCILGGSPSCLTPVSTFISMVIIQDMTALPIWLLFWEKQHTNNVITSARIGGHIMENDNCNLFFLILGESGLEDKKVNHTAAFNHQFNIGKYALKFLFILRHGLVMFSLYTPFCNHFITFFVRTKIYVINIQKLIQTKLLS